MPIACVAVLLGNDIAGGAVIPVPHVVKYPIHAACVEVPSEMYTACVVTRSQSKVLSENLKDISVLFGKDGDADATQTSMSQQVPSTESELREVSKTEQSLDVPISHATLIQEQQRDKILEPCFTGVAYTGSHVSLFYLENGILMRYSKGPQADNRLSDKTTQIFIPLKFRHKILSLAHESQWSGHLGIRKTYQMILNHFFWPGVKKDVVKFCSHCHTFKVVGKLNQVITPLPLSPLPIVGNPFDHIVVDCVGPLPPSKSGNQFLLTIMCNVTRFPEAIPLTSITTKSIIRALSDLFSLFGLPKVIQTDQGNNFKSGLFQKITQIPGIKHVTSLAYHPESQGVLERWHQTFKSMLKKYCYSTGRQWEEGVSFLLFAAREAPTDSLGYSPAQLLFGHTPRGPL